MPVAKSKPKKLQSVEVSGLPESLDEIYPALCRIQGIAAHGKGSAELAEIGAIAGRLLELLREDAAAPEEVAA